MRACHWGKGNSDCVQYQHELLACCVLVADFGHKHQSLQLHFLSLGLIRGVNRQYVCSIFCAEAHGDVTDFACVHCPIQPGSHTAYATMSLLWGTKCGTSLECLLSSRTGPCTAKAFV